MHQLIREAANFPRKIWCTPSKVFTQPNNFEKSIIVLGMILLCSILTFSDSYETVSSNQLYQQPMLMVVHFVPIIFLVGTLIKSTITNKANAVCLTISLFLLMFGLVCDYDIKKKIMVNEKNNDFLLDFMMFVKNLAFIGLGFMEYLGTNIRKQNLSDGSFRGMLNFMNGFRRWFYVFCAQMSLAYVVITSCQNSNRNELDSSLLWKSFNYFLLTGLPYLLFSLFMITREYMEYLQRSTIQKRKIRLNVAMFLIQWVLLINSIVIRNRQDYLSDSFQNSLCSILFFSSVCISLFNSFNISEFNEESDTTSSQVLTDSKQTEDFIRTISMLVLLVTVALTVVVLATAGYDLNLHVQIKSFVRSLSPDWLSMGS